MANLEDIEKIVGKKTCLAMEVISVETNVSDMGHFLDCEIRLLEKPFQDETIHVRFNWD